MISMTALLHLLVSYGYFAVLLVVALESMGIPAPFETILLIAAVTAGTTHQLSLPLVIGAAASGAILGDNLGYWIGLWSSMLLVRKRDGKSSKKGSPLLHLDGWNQTSLRPWKNV